MPSTQDYERTIGQIANEIQGCRKRVLYLRSELEDTRRKPSATSAHLQSIINDVRFESMELQRLNHMLNAIVFDG